MISHDPVRAQEPRSITWWTFRIFLIFSARGREGGPRRQRGRGAGRVSAGNFGVGGRLNVFFGAEIPTLSAAISAAYG